MLSSFNNIESITIGSFDGIHLAHKRLIDQADMVVVIERGCGYLTAGYRRTLYTDKPCAFYLFEHIRSLSPIEFISQLQNDFPNLQKIVVGYDFHFGAKKAGSANMLREIFDGEVVIVDEVMSDNISVHSKTIKRYLQSGDIEIANRLLDRSYTIDGRVIRGQGLGKSELLPTLNLSISNYLLPLDGVYATRSMVSKEWFDSVTFLGHRESTDGTYAVETHIIDRDIGIVISENVSIKFISYIRENRKFEKLSLLKDAILSDIEKAREILDAKR
ncbi:Riboflavin kinase / FMN adenylyltransferase [hydrothermal vent metagenome]|uniref:Bifunctional riboflavin kinase/FMN adenylyltransferase n=1 Tax=hydrothermal vent metagenome TaxID=652676 RepID=A0A1W1CBK7_9ZZZZ